MPDAPPTWFRITFADGSSVVDSVPAHEMNRSGGETLDAEFYFMKRWAHREPKGVPKNSEIVKVERIPPPRLGSV